MVHHCTSTPPFQFLQWQPSTPIQSATNPFTPAPQQNTTNQSQDKSTADLVINHWIHMLYVLVIVTQFFYCDFHSLSLFPFPFPSPSLPSTKVAFSSTTLAFSSGTSESRNTTPRPFPQAAPLKSVPFRPIRLSATITWMKRARQRPRLIHSAGPRRQMSIRVWENHCRGRQAGRKKHDGRRTNKKQRLGVMKLTAEGETMEP